MIRGLLAGAALAVLSLAIPTAASAAPCTPIVTSDGRALTTQYYDQSITGPATGGGCDVVAYYDTGSFTVDSADVSLAPRYGILADKGATVNVTNSQVHEIGPAFTTDPSLGGLQQGIAIEYIGGAQGLIQNDQVFDYQKGGFVGADQGTNVQILGNHFDGGGPNPIIARNGVEYVDHAAGLVRGNLIDRHEYTGCDNKTAKSTGCTRYDAAGILLYNIDQPTIDTSNNTFRDDDRNLFNTPSAAVK